MNQLSITALCITFNFVVLYAMPLQGTHHRERTDLQRHNSATNTLLTEYSSLADALKENIIRILNISNISSLDNEPLHTALGTTCTMKRIVDTLTATRMTVPEREDLEISIVQVLTTRIYYHSCELMVKEVELQGSLMTIETICLPLEELTANNTNNHSTTENSTTTSDTNTETTHTTNETITDSTTETTPTTSETITDSITGITSRVVDDLCSYWHTLKLVEATESDLTTLLMALRNEENILYT